uniref:NADH-ubiquinone oxidoreductase chain 2 n=1 Tax=Chalcophana sp. N69 TaxID=2653421 RepID=A0A5Q0U1B2_9CUCU|nr:NADH dehydrogenase subunit 2 [Chalcophana sp. N69]
MMKYYKMTFFIFMTAGTLITLSSYSWLSLWLGLEINLMMIIPLLVNTKNKFPTEAALKYFIVQVLASLIFLFSMIFIVKNNEQMPSIPKNFVMISMLSSICIKLGAAPFHAWFPEVIEGLSWINSLIMLTWQKLAPMIILMNNLMTSKFIIVIIVTSILISSIMGLNQVSLHKIMAYSSINHIAWMLSSMIYTKAIFFVYFVIYSLITTTITLSLNMYKIMFISQMTMNKINKLMNFTVTANLFSLGGLPPFLGFLPKWLTINSLIIQKNYLLATMLVIFSMLPLYFYLRVTFTQLALISKEALIKTELKSSTVMLTMNISALTGLALATLMVNAL